VRSLDAGQSQETKQSGGYLEEFKIFFHVLIILFSNFFWCSDYFTIFFQRSEIRYLREFLEQCDLCSPGKKLK